VEKLRSTSNGSSKRELQLQLQLPAALKDGPPGQIAAQTFTFRELAAATKNFRPQSFLGEGGFGRVYKGRLETTGQVLYPSMHPSFFQLSYPTITNHSHYLILYRLLLLNSWTETVSRVIGSSLSRFSCSVFYIALTLSVSLDTVPMATNAS